MSREVTSALVVFVAASGAIGQPDNDVSVDLTGVELRWILFQGWPDQVRDSANNPIPAGPAQTILPAAGYKYDADGTLSTSGLFSSLVPSGSSIGDLLDTVQDGQSRLLNGYVRNASGGLPNPENPVWIDTFEGDVGGFDLSVTIDVHITNGGVGVFEIRDISIPLGPVAGTAEITSGFANLETWVPSPRQETEWHFDGDLSSTPGSADAEMRYLDDPTFGTILGGLGNLQNPDPSIPTGVTEQQSSFASTTSLGIVGPGGEEDIVYCTSPARNVTTGDPDHSRGLGLIMAPNLRPSYPGEWFGQWTMIWDLYIPSESWYEDYPANTSPREFPVALLQDNFNNDGNADLFVRNDPSDGPTLGFRDGEFTSYFPVSMQPDTWYRLALVSDSMQSGEARFYLDGVHVGTDKGDWLYCAIDPTNPLYGDEEPIDPGDWTAWGEFPNPWALSSGTHPGSAGPSGTASTICFFADLGDEDTGDGGRSEIVYLANLYFVDDLLTPTEVAALGGPDADGIVLKVAPCLADWNGDMQVNTGDFIAFLNDYNAVRGGGTPTFGDPDLAAPFGVLNTSDFLAFLNLFNLGC